MTASDTRMTMGVKATVLAALLLGTACGEADRPGSTPVDDTTTPPATAPDTAAPPETAGPEPAARPSDLRGYDTVFVYFDGPISAGGIEGQRVALSRAVPPATDALTFALRELLKGPTATDRRDGPYGEYSSWFSAETAGMLRSVALDDGFAVVNFDTLRSVIPNASTSAGSALLLGQLQATVFQFPEVRRVEFRIDGSCEAFMAWLQYGCVPLTRSGFTAPPGYRGAVPR